MPGRLGETPCARESHAVRSGVLFAQVAVPDLCLRRAPAVLRRSSPEGSLAGVRANIDRPNATRCGSAGRTFELIRATCRISRSRRSRRISASCNRAACSSPTRPVHPLRSRRPTRRWPSLVPVSFALWSRTHRYSECMNVLTKGTLVDVDVASLLAGLLRYRRRVMFPATYETERWAVSIDRADQARDAQGQGEEDDDHADSTLEHLRASLCRLSAARGLTASARRIRPPCASRQPGDRA